MNTTPKKSGKRDRASQKHSTPIRPKKHSGNVDSPVDVFEFLSPEDFVSRLLPDSPPESGYSGGYGEIRADTDYGAPISQSGIIGPHQSEYQSLISDFGGTTPVNEVRTSDSGIDSWQRIPQKRQRKTISHDRNLDTIVLVPRTVKLASCQVPRSAARTNIKGPLLVNFAESLIRGRLECSQRYPGFEAELKIIDTAALQLLRTSPRRIFSFEHGPYVHRFTAKISKVTEDRFSPFHAKIPLSTPSKSGSTVQTNRHVNSVGDCDQKCDKKTDVHRGLGKRTRKDSTCQHSQSLRYPRGSIQLIIKYPEKSGGKVAKIFDVPYDLYEMPVSSRTFIRQTNRSSGNGNVVDLVHFKIESNRSGKLFLKRDIQILFTPNFMSSSNTCNDIAISTACSSSKYLVTEFSYPVPRYTPKDSLKTKTITKRRNSRVALPVSPLAL